MKLTIEELRIGNYVRCTISNDAGKYKVLALPNWGPDGNFNYQMVTIDRCPRQTVVLDQIRGEKLTEEWLHKFGFESAAGDPYGGYLSQPFGTGARFRVQGDKGIFGHAAEFGWISLSFVHQLQNLFFCLCGKELEII